MSTNITHFSEREAEILKPLASVEVVEKEDATFETEISEEDVPGEWKLKGEVLTRSPVRLDEVSKVLMHAPLHLHVHFYIYKCTVMCPSDVRHSNGGWCA